MAFQFRRGTDAERQSITPKAGEPLFVTDTGKVFVGNGTTQGGVPVFANVSDDATPSLGGNLNLNNNDIVGTGNINITGTITATGDINLGDGAEDNVIVGGQIQSSLIPDSDATYDLGTTLSTWRSGFFENIDTETFSAIGNVTLGNGSEDTIIVNGQIDSSLVPNLDGEYDLGNSVASWRNGFFEGLTVDGDIEANSLSVGSIFKDNSGILYDGNSNTLIADLQGAIFDVNGVLLVDTLTGNATLGDVTADAFRGSLFADDSTLIVDGINLNAFFADVTAVDVTANAFQGSLIANDTTVMIDANNQILNMPRIQSPTNALLLANSLAVDESQQFGITSQVESFETFSQIQLRAESDIDLSSPLYNYGEIVWERNDVNGLTNAAFLRAGSDYITFGAGVDNESANEFANRIILLSGTLGIGVAPALDATEKLLVGGNAVVQGEVEASSFKGSLAADDSTIIVDSIDQIINSNQVRLNVLSEEIIEPASGTIAVADGIGWDPISTGQETMVVYLNGGWQALA